MAIIDNAKDIKKHNSAIEAGIEIVNFQSFIDDAINFFVIPTIGFATFQLIENAKANEQASDQLKRAVNLCQKAVVGYMVANYADNGALTINSVGIMVSRSEKTAPASDKKLMQLRKSNLRSAYGALELLVNHLEENINLFADYKTSIEHLKNRGMYINTTEEFQNAGVQINNDYQFYAKLKVYQATAEENHIVPVLGQTIADNLYAKVLANDLSNAEKGLLRRVRLALAPFTMAEALPKLRLSIDASGAYTLSETVGGISGNVENRTAPDAQEIKRLAMAYYSQGEAELETLQKFLNANALTYNYTVVNRVEMNDDPNSNIYFL